MKRRYFPARRSNSILLYCLGLTLTLSLVYNGYLLYDLNRQRSIHEYELGNAIHPVDLLDWQQQLSDCKRANQEKDSLIKRLENAPNAPPRHVVTTH